MIQANELRIGNWVFYNGEILLFDEDRARYFFDVKDEWEFLEPIPLTPEILEKAWFVKDDDASSLEPIATVYELVIPVKGDNINEIMFTFVKDGGVPSFGSATVNGHWASNNFQYLHQLQNLYFALTGEELKIFL